MLQCAGCSFFFLCYFGLYIRTHVETVCLLSKLHEAKHHINVKVDMDELDITSAEAKATYKEIEEWVQEHYGFHVTNLNIAQVKQNLVGEKYSENPKESEAGLKQRCPFCLIIPKQECSLDVEVVGRNRSLSIPIDLE